MYRDPSTQETSVVKKLSANEHVSAVERSLENGPVKEINVFDENDNLIYSEFFQDGLYTATEVIEANKRIDDMLFIQNK